VQRDEFVATFVTKSFFAARFHFAAMKIIYFF